MGTHGIAFPIVQPLVGNHLLLLRTEIRFAHMGYSLIIYLIGSREKHQVLHGIGSLVGENHFPDGNGMTGGIGDTELHFRHHSDYFKVDGSGIAIDIYLLAVAHGDSVLEERLGFIPEVGPVVGKGEFRYLYMILIAVKVCWQIISLLHSLQAQLGRLNIGKGIEHMLARLQSHPAIVQGTFLFARTIRMIGDDCVYLMVAGDYHKPVFHPFSRRIQAITISRSGSLPAFRNAQLHFHGNAFSRRQFRNHFRTAIGTASHQTEDGKHPTNI